MELLRLSVIIGNYNHGQYISEAITSIVEQSRKPFEVIICDDASTDNSVEIIQKFADKYPFIRLVRNKTNIGTTATLGRLIDLASGDYLYAIGADDKFLPDFFKKSLDILAQYPQAGISSGLSFIIDGDGKKIGFITAPLVSFKKPSFFPPDKVREIFLKKECWISGYSAIVRRDCLISCGGYRADLYSFQDSFAYQVIALKFGACFIPEPVMCCRRLAGSYSEATSGKPEIFGKTIENATSLMRTTFSGIFPEEYVKKWRRRSYFALEYGIFKNRCKEKMEKFYSRRTSIWMMGGLGAWLFKRYLFLEEAAVFCWLALIFKQNILRRLYNKALCLFIGKRYESRLRNNKSYGYSLK